MIKRAWLRWSLALGAAIYLALAFGTTEVNWTRVWEGLPRGVKFFSAFFPPDFVSRWSEIAEGIEESLWMTVVSTVDRHRAVDPGRHWRRQKHRAGAGLLFLPRHPGGVAELPGDHPRDLLRQAVRLRPVRGLVTLAFATIGFYGKLLAEDIEDMDPAQAEAVRATGAGWLQWINYGVQPQVMPRMIGLGLYRFDINFRESAVVGIVGGGGIGATLNTAFDRYEFDSAAAILLVIIAIVMVVEYSSGYLRRWVQ